MDIQLASKGTEDNSTLRVLTVIDSLATGGAETLVCGAARALAARGDTNVSIVALYPDLSEAWRLEETQVPVMTLGMRGKRDLQPGVRRLQREIARFRPNVVHTHLFPADLVTILAARGRRPDIPMILSEHAESNRRRRLPFSRYFEGWVYGQYDRIICVSTMVERASVARIPHLHDRTIVVPNSVEIPTSRWCAQGPFTVDLIFVGRLFRQKGLDLLIDALSLLRSRGMVVNLTVVGEGPRQSEYERMVGRHNLSEQVHFIGCRRDVQGLMRRARAVVMPSRFEGLSMVLLEAMALGMPVVATAVSGASETIEDQLSGYLVRPRDVHALAEGISAVLIDPEFAMRLGDNARRTVERNFSMMVYAGRLRGVYEEVAKSHPRPSLVS